MALAAEIFQAAYVQFHLADVYQHQPEAYIVLSDMRACRVLRHRETHVPVGVSSKYPSAGAAALCSATLPSSRRLSQANKLGPRKDRFFRVQQVQIPQASFDRLETQTKENPVLTNNSILLLVLPDQPQNPIRYHHFKPQFSSEKSMRQAIPRRTVQRAPFPPHNWISQ